MEVDVKALVDLTLMAFGEAQLARAESRVALALLKSAGIPEETINEAFAAAARAQVTELTRHFALTSVSPEVAQAIIQRLLAGLSAPEGAADSAPAAKN